MTRYPSKGKWTVKELDAIPVGWKGDALNDGDGLRGEVRVSSNGNVSIAFRYGFKWQSKKVWHYCGTYPSATLYEIRKARDDARLVIEMGIDPRSKKVADKIIEQNKIEATIAEAKQKIINAEIERTKNLTFQDLFNHWTRDGVNRSDSNTMINSLFKNHAIPKLGAIPLRELSESHLLDTLRDIFSQGKTRTAIMLYKDIGQMLRWAEKRKPYRGLMVDGNPAELVDIEKLIPSDYKEERNRYLSDDEIRKLNNIFMTDEIAYKNAKKKYEIDRPLIKETQIALWLCLSTLCRIGELLMTEWRHVDFEARTWLIPKENVKGTRRNKQSQLVYLSDFSFDRFKELHAITGDSKWAFPAKNNSKEANNHVCVKSVSKQVGDRQTQFKQRTKDLKNRVNNNSLVLGDKDWCPHDLRRTGATIMQGQLKISLDVIDRCQNHVLAGSKVRRHYLHHEYADEKRDAWQKLGEKLNALLNLH